MLLPGFVPWCSDVVRAHREVARWLAMLLLGPTTAWAHPPASADEPEPSEAPAPVDEPVAAESSANEASGEATGEGDELPFDNVDVDELVHDTEAASGDPAPPPALDRTRMSDIADPFPDRGPVGLPWRAGTLLGLAVGFSTASAIVSRSSLLPECRDPDEITTCAVPNAADIGVRGGRFIGAIAFAVGGAAFGGLGGRELGLVLRSGPASTFDRRRAIAIGVGSTALTLGVAGLVAGSVMFGLGTKRTVDIGRRILAAETDDERLSMADEGEARLRMTRAGLVLMLASPTPLVAGATLLAARPRRPFSVAPALSRAYVGVSMSGRF